MSHSIIPPSSADIWGKPNGCTGWVLMAQQYPQDEETQDAADGEASHEIGATLINDASRGFISDVTADKFIGKAATNGTLFTEEMFDAAKIYADDVGEIMRQYGIFGGPNFGTEARVESKRIHELSFGTTDQFIYDANSHKLFIWDYKFGHEVVEAFENWQMINYLAGILEQLEINGHEDQQITVHIRIIQPRAFHRDGIIREWVVKASDLRGHFNILEANAAESLGNNAVCRSGPHCKHCTARHDCEAALTAAMSFYEVAMKPIPITMSFSARGLQLAILKRARKHIERLEIAFEEQIKNTIRGGKLVPGWKLEQGLGHEKWNKPIPEVIALGDMMGHDLRKPTDVKTPTQARSLGIDGDVISAYANKPKTSLKLVQETGIKTKTIFLGEYKND